MKKLMLLFICVLSTLLIGCNNGDSDILGAPPDDQMPHRQLIVTPKEATLHVGLTRAMKATAIIAGNVIIDITYDPELTWSSDDQDVATVNSNGIVSALRRGDVTITASGSHENETYSDSAELTIENSTVMKLKITSESEEIPVHFSLQMKAQINLSDGSEPQDVTHSPTLTWSVADGNTPDGNTVASIENTGVNKGLVTGLSVGVATIIASVTVDGETMSSSITIDVTDVVMSTLNVTPDNAGQSIPIGLTKQFRAIGYFSDGLELDITNQAHVVWTVEPPTDASISNTGKDKGLVTGIDEGEVKVTATVGKDCKADNICMKDEATLTIDEAVITRILITPEKPKITIGETLQLTATAFFSDDKIDPKNVTASDELTWIVRNGGIYSEISNDHEDKMDKGTITGLLDGSSTILVSGTIDGDVQSDLLQLTVDSTIPYVVTWGSQDGGGKPPALEVLVGITDIFSTDTAFAALNNQGGVVTWGSSGLGGDSSIVADQLTTDIEKIFATGTAFAALKTDPENDKNKTVVVWGDPKNGGDSNDTFVSSLTYIKGIYSTNYAFAAIDVNDEVFTWGSKKMGGETPDDMDTHNIKAIYSNKYAFAAITMDEKIRVWGIKSYGGNQSKVDAFLKDGDLYLDIDIEKIFSTQTAFVALDSNGQLYAWGAPVNGGEINPELEGVAVNDVYSTLTAFAAVTDNGDVITWGDKINGGNSDAVKGDLKNVSTVCATDFAFAALIDDENNKVFTWGNTLKGGNSSDVSDALIHIKNITATDSAFAALTEDGEVVTWGDPTNGGDSSAVADDLKNIQVIYANDRAFAALRGDGVVITWGDDPKGGDSGLVSQYLTNINKVFSTRFAFAALKN